MVLPGLGIVGAHNILALCCGSLCCCLMVFIRRVTCAIHDPPDPHRCRAAVCTQNLERTKPWQGWQPILPIHHLQIFVLYNMRQHMHSRRTNNSAHCFFAAEVCLDRADQQKTHNPSNYPHIHTPHAHPYALHHPQTPTIRSVRRRARTLDIVTASVDGMNCIAFHYTLGKRIKISTMPKPVNKYCL